MSLILDALRKLERERAARRSRESGSGPSFLYTREQPPASGYRLAPIAAVVAVVAGLAVLGLAFFFLAGKRAAPPPAPPQAASVPAPAPPQPAAPHPEPRPAQPSPPVSASSAEPPRAGGDRKSPEPTSGPAQLQVTGIAWQDERTGRRAVVNGQLVAEGAMAAGARVVEIRPDRVRFDVGGRTVEVLLSSPLPGT